MIGILNWLKQKLTLNKEGIKSLIISVAITVLFWIGLNFLGNYFIEAMWIIILTILIILLSVIMLFTGFIVLRSLVMVGAEVSLLIYLAQSYCDIPNHLSQSDDALRSLISFSLIFIVVAFCKSLYKDVQEKYKLIKTESLGKEKAAMIALFLIFTSLFIRQIYLVTNPIILNLCVYK